VFTALTEEIGQRWTHSFKEKHRVILESKVGGRFYEQWDGQAGALYAVVTYLDPPVKLPADEVESYRSGWKELLGVTLRAYVERSGS
jgi:aryl-alcohol dehydrogenase-like predicted oxidoreductase